MTLTVTKHAPNPEGMDSSSRTHPEAILNHSNAFERQCLRTSPEWPSVPNRTKPVQGSPGHFTCREPDHA